MVNTQLSNTAMISLRSLVSSPGLLYYIRRAVYISPILLKLCTKVITSIGHNHGQLVLSINPLDIPINISTSIFTHTYTTIATPVNLSLGPVPSTLTPCLCPLSCFDQ